MTTPTSAADSAQSSIARSHPSRHLDVVVAQHEPLPRARARRRGSCCACSRRFFSLPDDRRPADTGRAAVSCRRPPRPRRGSPRRLTCVVWSTDRLEARARQVSARVQRDDQRHLRVLRIRQLDRSPAPRPTTDWARLLWLWPRLTSVGRRGGAIRQANARAASPRRSPRRACPARVEKPHVTDSSIRRLSSLAPASSTSSPNRCGPICSRHRAVAALNLLSANRRYRGRAARSPGAASFAARGEPVSASRAPAQPHPVRVFHLALHPVGLCAFA